MTIFTRSRRRSTLTILAVLACLMVVGACSGAGATFVGGEAGARDDAGGGVAAQPQQAPEAPGVASTETNASQVDGALIVRTGSLDMEVADFDAAIARARTVVTGFGGYISGSQMATDGDAPYASITYRIPSDRWDDALAALKLLGTKVISEQTQAVDVTTAVVDLDARIENLRVTEQSLQAIMTQATKIPDILEVQNQLTAVRGQIEQLTAEREHLAQQASYGTLTVGWSVPVVAVTTVQGEWDPASIVDEALARLVQLGQGATTAAIWLVIVGLPLLLIGVVVVGLVLLVARRLSRPRPEPTAATTES
ncbi:MAG TPA: DUF4349 domain-containing protein [Candidatus Limnocylindrales bacterium]|jgi:hypothetical protein